MAETERVKTMLEMSEIDAGSSNFLASAPSNLSQHPVQFDDVEPSGYVGHYLLRYDPDKEAGK